MEDLVELLAQADAQHLLAVLDSREEGADAHMVDDIAGHQAHKLWPVAHEDGAEDVALEQRSAVVQPRLRNAQEAKRCQPLAMCASG